MLGSSFPQTCPEAPGRCAGHWKTQQARPGGAHSSGTQSIHATGATGGLTPAARHEGGRRQHPLPRSPRGEGQGGRQRGGDFGAEPLTGMNELQLCDHQAGSPPCSTTCWLRRAASPVGASGALSVIFRGYYISGKGVILLYTSPLTQKETEQDNRSDYLTAPSTNNGGRPGSPKDDKTTGGRQTGSLLGDGAGRAGGRTVKIKITRKGHRKPPASSLPARTHTAPPKEDPFPEK